MPTVTHVVAYQFDELSDDAKETARGWFRTDYPDYPDYEWWDSTYEDAERIGLVITSFDLGRGQKIAAELNPSARDSARAVIGEHGPTCPTYKTAVHHLYVRRHSGFDWSDESYLHDILEDYWIMLRDEYEYLLSDESVDESIRCNEYLFTVEGRRTLCL